MAKSKTQTKSSSKTPTRAKPIPASFEDFKTFIRAHLPKCNHDSGSGLSAQFPSFELMPQDYLAYANEALAVPTDANKINCIAHLKRAAECQADTLFHILSIAKFPKTRNFPSKMDTIAHLDLMPSRSVAELNSVRNKMEHEYAVPQIEDLSLYFDLVAGFVSAVEGAIFMLVSTAEMNFAADEAEPARARFDIKYIATEPEIVCAMNDGKSESVYSVKPDDWERFIDSLRIFFLLIRFAYIVSDTYVLNRLDKKQAT